MSIARKRPAGVKTAPNCIGSWISSARGEVLVVWKLDPLPRSLRDFLAIMERLADAKAGFRSLTERSIPPRLNHVE